MNELGKLETHKAIELNPRSSELQNIKTVIHDMLQAYERLTGLEEAPTFIL
ncbi:hypothetical protein [Halalkalibacter lacteus]|uniref:hypothetical protein n=1 Tax=Halalkalibacter lacteus TaxID=3090663 RepID=UPI002FC8A76A